MQIVVIHTAVPRSELAALAKTGFGDMIKAVVDVERRIMAVGGEMHADEATTLIQEGSAQANLWGINLYPDEPAEEWIEYDAMTNVRPGQNNRSRSVEDEALRNRIRKIVEDLVTG